MENLFFVLILISVLAYGINLPFLTYFVRKLNGITIVVYRNLSFIVTMLPLLFFVEFNEILKIQENLLILFLASLSGFVAFISLLNTKIYLPIGLSSGIRQAIYVITAFILGYLFLNETVNLNQIIVISIILISALSLSFSKIDVSHLKEKNILRGLFYAVLSATSHALSFFFFTKLARSVDPLVATYFWQASVGLIALIYAFSLKGKFGVPKIMKISMNQFLKISLISVFTTLIGTLSYAYAIRIGDFAIATSLFTTTIVIYTIAGYLLFKEKPSLKQLVLIALIVLSVILLKMIS